MDIFSEAIAAASAGVDTLIEVAKPIVALYVGYLLVRARTALLKGVPAWLHAVMASWIEQALMPIAINAVKAAEEHGARLAKEALARGDALIKARLSADKLAFAKQYILDRVPDWIVSDARLGSLIDAALVYIGRGATKGVTVGVEILERGIQRIPPPPTLPPEA